MNNERFSHVIVVLDPRIPNEGTDWQSQFEARSFNKRLIVILK